VEVLDIREYLELQGDPDLMVCRVDLDNKDLLVLQEALVHQVCAHLQLIASRRINNIIVISIMVSH